jgi:DNA-directed RNA polymerase specialized sigma subunit
MKLIINKNILSSLRVDLQFAPTKEEYNEIEHLIYIQKSKVEQLEDVLRAYGQDIINYANTFNEKKKEIFVLLYINNLTIKEVAVKTKYAYQTISNIKCDIDKLLNCKTLE